MHLIHQEHFDKLFYPDLTLCTIPLQRTFSSSHFQHLFWLLNAKKSKKYVSKEKLTDEKKGKENYFTNALKNNNTSAVRG